MCVCVCVSVCVCVCVSVSPAIRFHISQRIFSKFGGNIIWVMTCVHSLIFERIHFELARNILRLTISVKDYVLFKFTQRSHACERVRD
jgi:hypothetical protein